MGRIQPTNFYRGEEIQLLSTMDIQREWRSIFSIKHYTTWKVDG